MGTGYHCRLIGRSAINEIAFPKRGNEFNQQPTPSGDAAASAVAMLVASATVRSRHWCFHKVITTTYYERLVAYSLLLQVLLLRLTLLLGDFNNSVTIACALHYLELTGAAIAVVVMVFSKGIA